MLLHDEAEGEDECKRGRMRRGGGGVVTYAEGLEGIQMSTQGHPAEGPASLMADGGQRIPARGMH